FLAGKDGGRASRREPRETGALFTAVTDGVEVDGQAAAAIASVSPQTLLDPGIQYQFRTENGQGGVTYRVVQVAAAPDTATVVETNAGGAQVVTAGTAALVGQQVAQAIISSPFAAAANGGSSPTAEGEWGSGGWSLQDAQNRESLWGSRTVPAQRDAICVILTGQFYVMMSPQDVLQTTSPRALAPRTHQFSPKGEGNRTARDERRRATHNEVERRRRDKINNWIVKLSKIIPDCSSDLNKSGQASTPKGGILAKACDYINELRSNSARLPDILKENERLAVDVELLRQQCDQLKATNQLLKAHLQQHGIQVTEVVEHAS
ncbi:upstream stimulatory factor 2, usf2, putative, partial [Ixodes scapularis]